jgi:hypothetical protein
MHADDLNDLNVLRPNDSDLVLFMQAIYSLSNEVQRRPRQLTKRLKIVEGSRPKLRKVTWKACARSSNRAK